jgi:hypothetical protein
VHHREYQEAFPAHGINHAVRETPDEDAPDVSAQAWRGFGYGNSALDPCLDFDRKVRPETGSVSVRPYHVGWMASVG